MEVCEEDFDDMPSPYCPVCGHCGEIYCCGVHCFLENHVRGKTNCIYEDQIIDDIEEIFEFYRNKKMMEDNNGK